MMQAVWYENRQENLCRSIGIDSHFILAENRLVPVLNCVKIGFLFEESQPVFFMLIGTVSEQVHKDQKIIMIQPICFQQFLNPLLVIQDFGLAFFQ